MAYGAGDDELILDITDLDEELDGIEDVLDAETPPLEVEEEDENEEEIEEEIEEEKEEGKELPAPQVMTNELMAIREVSVVSMGVLPPPADPKHILPWRLTHYEPAYFMARPPLIDCGQGVVPQVPPPLAMELLVQRLEQAEQLVEQISPRSIYASDTQYMVVLQLYGTMLK
uniref:Male-enhanced antigen 1 n=1 Tax=Plectus sambesii TaxID=2011161 RepID=A0A914XMC9_9BILA